MLACLPPFMLAPRLLPLLSRLRSACQRLVPGQTCAGGDDLLDGLLLTLRERPFHVVLSLRLNPIPPAGLTSYALGLAGVVPLPKYVLASALGTAANTLAEAYVGELLTSLEALREGHLELTPRGATLAGISLAASFCLCMYLAHVGATSLAAARAAEGKGNPPATTQRLRLLI